MDKGKAERRMDLEVILGHIIDSYIGSDTALGISSAIYLVGKMVSWMARFLSKTVCRARYPELANQMDNKRRGWIKPSSTRVKPLPEGHRPVLAAS
jgi:hypothetical protein